MRTRINIEGIWYPALDKQLEAWARTLRGRALLAEYGGIPREATEEEAQEAGWKVLAVQAANDAMGVN